jgi:hypothetical protein
MNRNMLVTMLVTVVMAGQVLSAPSVSFSTGIANQYVAFGSGSVLYDKAVSQSDLNLTFENGVYVDLWGSKSLGAESWGSNSGDEVDYGFGWSGKIGNGFSLNVGLTYFDEPMAMSFGPCDVWYTHLKLSHDLTLGHGLGDVTLFGTYESFITTPGTSYEGGNLWSLGVSKTQAICKDLSVSTSGVLTYDDGSFGGDHGLLAKFGLELDWQVTDHFKVVLPQLNLYVPFAVSDCRDTEFVAYVGVSLNY